MLTYLKSLLATDTGKDTSIVVIGTIINAVIGGLFFLFAPRILDNPANFGLFATVISTGLMMAAIANFGLDTGIFKFAYKGSTETNAILSLALRTYMILGLIVAIFFGEISIALIFDKSLLDFFNKSFRSFAKSVILGLFRVKILSIVIY